MSLVWALPIQAEKAPASTPFLLLGSNQGIGDRHIGRGDEIISTEAVFAHLAISEEDIVGIDGKVGGRPTILLAKGEQLFGVEGPSNKITWCAVNHKTTGALDGFFVRNSDKHLCFIDDDGDQRFEASYDLRTKFTSNPIFYDVEIGGNRLPKPASYHIVDPRELKMRFMVEAFIVGLLSSATKAEIAIRVKSDFGTDQVTRAIQIPTDPASETMNILGSEFTLSRLDQKMVTAHVASGIASGLFTTPRPTFTYQFISY